MAISVSGTTITFNDATTQTTAGKSGTVTSVATGNGLSGGTITTSGTLVIAAPSAGSIGSYFIAGSPQGISPGSYYEGNTVSGSTFRNTSNISGSAAGTSGHDPGYTGTWRSCGGFTVTACGCLNNVSTQTLWVRIS